MGSIVSLPDEIKINTMASTYLFQHVNKDHDVSTTTTTQKRQCCSFRIYKQKQYYDDSKNPGQMSQVVQSNTQGNPHHVCIKLFHCSKFYKTTLKSISSIIYISSTTGKANAHVIRTSKNNITKETVNS